MLFTFHLYDVYTPPDCIYIKEKLNHISHHGITMFLFLSFSFLCFWFFYVLLGSMIRCILLNYERKKKSSKMNIMNKKRNETENNAGRNCNLSKKKLANIISLLLLLLLISVEKRQK